MTTHHPGSASIPRPHPSPQAVPSGQLAWLERELGRWQGDGLIDAQAAAAIRQRYVVNRRFSLARLLFVLGAGFLGVGLLWLVAANLDQIPPLTRFVLAVIAWLAATAAAELMAGRTHTSRAAGGASDRGDDEGSPVLGGARLLAALFFGAVVFQAAQSLQVPAYSSILLGTWGAGALLYAYAVGGVAPLVVGIITSVGWYAWSVGERTDNAVGAAMSFLVAGAACTAVAVAHAHRWRTDFASPWRQVAALLMLVGLFIAALPNVAPDRLDVPASLWVGALAAALAAAGAAALTGRSGRLELAVTVAIVIVGLALLDWNPLRSSPDQPLSSELLSGSALAYAVISVAVYLAVAVWFAALGVLRDTPRLTAVATAALVLFVTVQSFAVFAPIFSGAALFLALGVVFLISGLLADRGRRRLVATVTEATGTEERT